MDINKTIPENTPVEIPATEDNFASAGENENTLIENTQEPEVVVVPKTRRFWQKPRFIFGIILILALIGLIFYLINVFNVYREAAVYKKTHDIAIKELIYCDSIKGTSQNKAVFNYCDQLEDRFKAVER